MSAHSQLALFNNMRNINDMLDSSLGKELPEYEKMSTEEYLERCLKDMKREANQYYQELEDMRDKVLSQQTLINDLMAELQTLKEEKSALKSKLLTMARTMEVTRSCD